MKTYTKDELSEILRLHKMWLMDEYDGVRADLSYSNLTGSDLTGSDLTGSDLSYSNLTGSDLTGSDLTGSNLGYSVGSNSRISSLQIEPYHIVILDKEICWVGYTEMTCQEWLDYSGDNLSEVDRVYLETITKPFIKMVLGGVN